MTTVEINLKRCLLLSLSLSLLLPLVLIQFKEKTDLCHIRTPFFGDTYCLVHWRVSLVFPSVVSLVVVAGSRFTPFYSVYHIFVHIAEFFVSIIKSLLCTSFDHHQLAHSVTYMLSRFFVAAFSSFNSFNSRCAQTINAYSSFDVLTHLNSIQMAIYHVILFIFELNAYQLNSACCHCNAESVCVREGARKSDMRIKWVIEKSWKVYQTMRWASVLSNKDEIIVTHSCEVLSHIYNVYMHACLPAAANVRVRISAKKQMLQFVMYEKP